MTPARPTHPTERPRSRRGATRRKLSLVLPGSADSAGAGGVTLLNLTSAGALLRTDLSLRPGERIRLALPNGEDAGAKVLWCDAPYFGCRFDSVIGKAAFAAMVLAAAPQTPEDPAPTAPEPRLPDSFGARLEHMRRQHGWSLADLASQVGVSKPALWKWEQGSSRPRPAALERLAAILGQTPSGLLFGDPAEIAPEPQTAAGGPLQPILDDARRQLAAALSIDSGAIELTVTIRA